MKVFILLIAMLVSTDTSSSVSREEMNNKKPLFSFGIIADIQYCDCEPEGTRYYRNSLKKLDEAMQFFATENLEFIINLGDIIDRDFKSFAPVYDILDNYHIPMLTSPGNHDYSVDRKYFRDLPFRSAGKDYYSEVHHGFRFIIINSNEISIYGPGNMKVRKEAGLLIEKMKAEGKENAVSWNGGISSGQLEWIETELEKSEEAGEKVFIACHFPVWPSEKHVVLNQDEVLSILSKHDNIIAWFAGHDHKGGYGNYNLIHCVTFRGMVETPDENSFAIVDVYENKIWIRGIGREKSRILAY